MKLFSYMYILLTVKLLQFVFVEHLEDNLFNPESYLIASVFESKFKMKFYVLNLTGNYKYVNQCKTIQFFGGRGGAGG